MFRQIEGTERVNFGKILFNFIHNFYHSQILVPKTFTATVTFRFHPLEPVGTSRKTRTICVHNK